VDGDGLSTVRAAAVALAAVLSLGFGGSSGAAHTATLDHVIDGDTLRLDDGTRVRLIGIDTPETDPNIGVECFGAEATAFVEALIDEGDEIELVFDEERFDQYGRTLAYVYRAGDGLFVNAELLRRGYATVELYSPNLDHAKQFRRLARRAREKELGLWSECSGGV
jgi:micrococcal nuclease